METNEFFRKWNGKPLDFDGVFGNQCVDTTKQYFQDVLNLPPYTGDAIDYWLSPPLGFKKIPKTLTNKPQPGDIIIWGTDYNPVYGHIAICNWVGWFNLNVFEQNNPLGSPCHFETRSYRGVVGWLRPPLRATMRYTCFNADPSLMEEARKILYRLSEGKLNASFTYKTHQRTQTGIFTFDEQVQFVKSQPIQTPFIYYFYNSGQPNYNQMATASVTSKKIMTAATIAPWTPLLVCFEFANALSKLPGVPGDADINTPSEEFIKAKLDEIIPVLEGGIDI